MLVIDLEDVATVCGHLDYVSSPFHTLMKSLARENNLRTRVTDK